MGEWLPCWTCKPLERSARLVAHMRTLVARIHRREHSPDSSWKYCDRSPCQETARIINGEVEGKKP